MHGRLLTLRCHALGATWHVCNRYIEGLMGERDGLRGMSVRAVVDQMVLSFSEGKGGGFFFWSIDRRFMVKTLECARPTLS